MDDDDKRIAKEVEEEFEDAAKAFWEFGACQDCGSIHWNSCNPRGGKAYECDQCCKFDEKINKLYRLPH